MLEKEELAWFSLIQFIIYGGALVQSKEVRSQKPAREKQNWNTLMKSKPNLFWIQILNLTKAQFIRSAKLSNIYFDITLLKYAKLFEYCLVALLYFDTMNSISMIPGLCFSVWCLNTAAAAQIIYAEKLKYRNQTYTFDCFKVKQYYLLANFSTIK